ncbi:phosphotransacetylase family protein [Gloeobacter kilaueensis]|uniref:Phosphate acetyltransferase n=1 Tax=Gloeobacter kilaueensis (strain ATCC BAA-2537 / CCAP 1431/1 / ULC 316 / JS1) TaxID=1183438 RepID=U5QC36_GLOK1|nr:phosphotransacetylase family protein [Gloeobacter kilaueensis]AGY56411.1 phosphate acetyltransferase [Gloeobacter kilaueensis JS1]
MNLLIGSTTACSGKSAVTLGLGLHLEADGLQVSYAKPLGNHALDVGGRLLDEDCATMGKYLRTGMPVGAPLVFLDRASVRRRLSGEDNDDYLVRLRDYAPATGQLHLIEGAGTPQEGAMFGLTLQVLAEQLPARVLLVCRYQEDLVIDQLLILRSQLGNRLLGVVLNDVPADQIEDLTAVLVPFLERQGIAVLATLPADTALQSVSVAELASALDADVLCCRDQLDLMVESVHIGAMSVNAAIKYFRTAANKAVITGGDRTDIQLAALETSTTCLILTGHLAAAQPVLARAEQLEVPVLSVHHDTLGTTEIVDRLFGQVRFREAVKVQRIQQLLAQHFDFERLRALLGLNS